MRPITSLEATIITYDGCMRFLWETLTIIPSAVQTHRVLPRYRVGRLPSGVKCCPPVHSFLRSATAIWGETEMGERGRGREKRERGGRKKASQTTIMLMMMAMLPLSHPRVSHGWRLRHLFPEQLRKSEMTSGSRPLVALSFEVGLI